MLDQAIIDEFEVKVRQSPYAAIELIRRHPELSTANIRYAGVSQTVDGTRAIHFAAWHNPPTLLNYLIDSSVDIHARTIDGETALHIAAQANNVPGIGLLLDHGADIERPMIDGRTPVDLCIEDQESAFEALLSRGADPGILAPVAWNRVDLVERALATRTVAELSLRVPDLPLLFQCADLCDDPDPMLKRLRSAGFRE